jgi:AcrR family transcriptional regulator
MNPTPRPLEAGARQRRKEARPQELLDAALALFVEKGFAATRTDEVAQQAGVSKGTLYLYYPSKEELFKAVVRHNLSSADRRRRRTGRHFCRQQFGTAGHADAHLVAACGQHHAAGIHKIMLAEVRNFPELAQFYTDEVMVPADRLFSGCVQRGIHSGEFRAMPVHEVAHALIAPLIFMAVHRHSFGCCPVHGGVDVDPGVMLETHLDLVLRGLEVRARRSPPRMEPTRRQACSKGGA